MGQRGEGQMLVLLGNLLSLARRGEKESPLNHAGHHRAEHRGSIWLKTEVTEV